MKEYFLYPLCKILDIILPKQSLKGIPILMYHSISADSSHLSINPHEFAKQTKYLFKKGYQTILPQQLDSIGFKNFAKKILITFDDGFEDNYRVALSMLKKYNFIATVFITTKYLDSLIENSKSMLKPEQIKDLEQNGWCIANHFDSHRDLTEISSEEIIKDFEIARGKLNNVLFSKKTANIVSYPYSRYNGKVIEAVKEAGVEMAFGGGNRSFKGKNSRLAIPRIEISPQVNFLKFKLILSPSFHLIKKLFVHDRYLPNR